MEHDDDEGPDLPVFCPKCDEKEIVSECVWLDSFLWGCPLPDCDWCESFEDDGTPSASELWSCR